MAVEGAGEDVLYREYLATPTGRRRGTFEQMAMGCPSVADSHPAYHHLFISVLPITRKTRDQ
jgi:hypothetical protein